MILFKLIWSRFKALNSLGDVTVTERELQISGPETEKIQWLSVM